MNFSARPALWISQVFSGFEGFISVHVPCCSWTECASPTTEVYRVEILPPWCPIPCGGLPARRRTRRASPRDLSNEVMDKNMERAERLSGPRAGRALKGRPPPFVCAFNWRRPVLSSRYIYHTSLSPQLSRGRPGYEMLERLTMLRLGGEAAVHGDMYCGYRPALLHDPFCCVNVALPGVIGYWNSSDLWISVWSVEPPRAASLLRSGWCEWCSMVAVKQQQQGGKEGEWEAFLLHCSTGSYILYFC